MYSKNCGKSRTYRHKSCECHSGTVSTLVNRKVGNPDHVTSRFDVECKPFCWRYTKKTFAAAACIGIASGSMQSTVFLSSSATPRHKDSFESRLA